MNSEKAVPADTAHLSLTRQAIVERNHALWGHEVCVFGEPLEHAYNEALRHISPRRKTSSSASQTFLRVDQSVLMNENFIKQIIQAARALEEHKQSLTLSIDNPLDALPGPVERRTMVRQLYRLKDQCDVQLAFSNYRLDTKQADLLVDLKLYDFIKMPFPDSALRLSLNTRSDLFDRLYDRMLDLISATRVRFIADNVEFDDSALLAKNLPFEYFQGGYYSPADRL